MGVTVLFTTDWHIRGNSPSTRKDNFPETLKNKVREIISLGETLHVDAIVIGGDVFQRPDTQYSVIRDFGRILMESKVPIYTIVGNHDVYGYNIATLNRTALGIVSGFGMIKIIKDHEPIFLERDGVKLQLTGRSFHYKMDKQDPKFDYFVKKDPSADFAMHVVHGNMLPKTIFKGMPHTLIEQIETEADVTAAGHFHPGFKMVEKNGKFFMNDGSISRINASTSEVARTVQVTLVDFDKSGITFSKIPLKSAPNADDVIDRTKLEERAEKELKMQAFTSEIERAGAMKRYSSEEILDVLSSKEEIADDIKKEALDRIGKAQEHVSINNSLPKPTLTNVFIEKMIIQNFQSHSYTEILFDHHGINVLCGESHQGKTAALRALKWVLLNEQRGKDFIRAGETNAQVTVCFPNNISITRLRTPSKNQYILNKDGEVQTFEGFGNEVPKEIVEIHGISKIAIDEDGKVKLSLNIANQMDGPFLLSLGGSFRAKALGIITGVDVIDYATEDVNGEISTLASEKKTCKDIIDANTAELVHYEDLDEFKASIDNMECKLNKVKEIVKKMQLLENVKSRFEVVSSSIEYVEGVINKLGNLNELEIKLTKTEQKIKDALTLDRFNAKYTQIESQIQVCQDVISKTECLPSLDKKMTSLEDKLSNFNKLVKAKEQYEGLKKQGLICKDIIAKTNNLQNTLSKVTKLEQLQTKIQELDKLHCKVIDFKNTAKQINVVLNKTKNVEELYKKILVAEQVAAKVEKLQKLSDKATEYKNSYRQINAVLAKLGNIDNLENRLKSLEELNAKIEKLSSLSVNYKTIDNRTIEGRAYIDNITNKIEMGLQRYKQELTKLGECPVCESKIDAKVVENIIKEYRKGDI